MAENYMGRRVCTRAGLAVMACDGLTGRPAEAGVLRICGLEGIRVEKKAGGILVLLDTPVHPFKIRLESPIYDGEELEIRPEGTACIMKKVYLNPGPAYLPGPGVLCLSGRAEPGEMVYASVDGKDKKIRLLKDSGKKGGEGLWLYSSTGEELSGRLICLISGDSGKKEWVRLGDQLEEPSGYRTRTALQNDYKKTGTKVVLVYGGRADPRGFYRILLPESEGTVYAWSRGVDGAFQERKQETGRGVLKLDFWQSGQDEDQEGK